MVYKVEVKAPDRRRRLAWGGDVNSECSRGIIWRETDGRLARTCRLSQIQTPKELRAFKRFNSRGDRDVAKLIKQKWEINRAHVSPAVTERGRDESRANDSRNSEQRLRQGKRY